MPAIRSEENTLSSYLLLVLIFDYFFDEQRQRKQNCLMIERRKKKNNNWNVLLIDFHTRIFTTKWKYDRRQMLASTERTEADYKLGPCEMCACFTSMTASSRNNNSIRRLMWLYCVSGCSIHSNIINIKHTEYRTTNEKETKKMTLKNGMNTIEINIQRYWL